MTDITKDLEAALKARRDLREGGCYDSDDFCDGYERGLQAALLITKPAANALATCKAAAERALGATAGSTEEAVELLATEHLNLQRELEAARATNQLLAYPGRDAEGNLPPLSSLLDGPDPAPVALPPRNLRRALQMPDAQPPTFAEARAEFLAHTATPERDEFWRKGAEAAKALAEAVKALAEEHARTIDAALRTMLPKERLAVHTDATALYILILAPGQAPPLGKPWTVYEAPQDVTAHFDPDLMRRGGRWDGEPDAAYKERVRSYFGAAPATMLPGRVYLDGVLQPEGWAATLTIVLKVSADGPTSAEVLIDDTIMWAGAALGTLNFSAPPGQARTGHGVLWLAKQRGDMLDNASLISGYQSNPVPEVYLVILTGASSVRYRMLLDREPTFLESESRPADTATAQWVGFKVKLWAEPAKLETT